MTQKIKKEYYFTQQQQELLNEIEEACQKAKELKENSSGYVVATSGAEINYCYCGEGNGYKGAPLRPSCMFAEVFESKEEAEEKASLLNYMEYRNGLGQIIKLEVKTARVYFFDIYIEMIGMLEDTKNIMAEANNLINKKKPTA